MRVRITSTGLYVPPKVETAAELAPRLGVTEAWILKLTGVARRHISEIPVEEMAAAAGREALAGGPPPDLILNGSATVRQMIPDTSVFIQRQLGFEGIPSFSIHSTCLSFLVALHLAAQHVATGAYRRVLVVSAEKASLGRNFREPESCALLGDGAAAVIVEPTPPGEDSAFLGWSMATFPAGAELTELRVGMDQRHPGDPGTTADDYLFRMDGRRAIFMAREPALKCAQEAVARAGLESLDQIDLFVPHQASLTGLKIITRILGIPEARWVNVLGEYGNTVAASIPMALVVAEREGRIKRGDRIMLGGTGAGLSVAAAVLRW